MCEYIERSFTNLKELILAKSGKEMKGQCGNGNFASERHDLTYPLKKTLPQEFYILPLSG